MKRLILLPALLLWFVSCGAPTAPNLDSGSVPVVIGAEQDFPYFVWFGRPSPARRTFGAMAWQRNATCVGIDPRLLRRMPLFVMKEPVPCGPILAAGCTFFDGRHGAPLSVAVWDRYFDTALPNELMHVALWLKGHKDSYGHPLFYQCKWW